MRNNLLEMSDRRRDLIFRVMDEQSTLLPILHYFTKWRRCDEILVWCVRNRMTGKNLLAWIHGEFKTSLLSLIKYILMKIDQESKPLPLFAGKDFIARH